MHKACPLSLVNISCRPAPMVHRKYWYCMSKKSCPFHIVSEAQYKNGQDLMDVHDAVHPFFFFLEGFLYNFELYFETKHWTV